MMQSRDDANQRCKDPEGKWLKLRRLIRRRAREGSKGSWLPNLKIQDSVFSEPVVPNVNLVSIGPEFGPMSNTKVVLDGNTFPMIYYTLESDNYSKSYRRNAAATYDQNLGGGICLTFGLMTYFVDPRPINTHDMWMDEIDLMKIVIS